MDTEITETKSRTKEVPVVQDHGSFEHFTGDKYEGCFEAKKKDRSIKMHGSGVYTTSEGDAYSGTWQSDNLASEATISYVEGAKYQGSLKDWMYNGPGKYQFPDGTSLECNFVNNAPIGSLVFFDTNGHKWLGMAGQGCGWLEPVNHYYDMLESVTEFEKSRKSHKHKHSRKNSK